MPWGKYADERLDLDEAERVLDEDHAGLEKVKEAVLKFLAVEVLMQKINIGKSSTNKGISGIDPKFKEVTKLIF
jgi:ATP-dependent Lon protease